jgi:hypothetical protein
MERENCARCSCLPTVCSIKSVLQTYHYLPLHVPLCHKLINSSLLNIFRFADQYPVCLTFYTSCYIQDIFTCSIKINACFFLASCSQSQRKHRHLTFSVLKHAGREYVIRMSSNVPAMTTLIYLFNLPMELHRSKRFGVFFIHHLQEHLIVFISVVFPVHFQNCVCLFSSEWFKRYKTCTSLSQYCTKHFYT